MTPPAIEAFFDPITSSLTYVVYRGADAVVIDPVLDYDPRASQTSTASVEAVGGFLRRNQLTLHYILETHPHADHLSASQWLRRHYGGHVAIGRGICAVQARFGDLLGLDTGFATDGRQFDRLLADGEAFHAGSLAIDVIATPGHTPACVSYRIDDAVFVGDALFLPDYGTARCDFPGGDGSALFASIQRRLYALPGDTRVFVGHDYQPGGRALRWMTTIDESRRTNIHLRADTTHDEFVALRAARDRTLTTPNLFYPSLHVNVNAGRLPRERGGRRYLSIPINLAAPTDDDGTPSR